MERAVIMKTKKEAMREIAKIRVEQARLQSIIDAAERIILRAMLKGAKDDEDVSE